MYIVNGLVRAHGGTVAIDDSAGGGARLEIRWPSDDRRDSTVVRPDARAPDGRCLDYPAREPVAATRTS